MTWPVRWRPALLAALTLATLPRRADGAAPDPRPGAQADAAPRERRRAIVTLQLADEARFREVLRAAIDAASVDLDIDVLVAGTRESPAAAVQVTVVEGSAWYDEMLEGVRQILAERRQSLEAVTKSLMEQETIDSEMLKQIIDETTSGARIVPGTAAEPKRPTRIKADEPGLEKDAGAGM